MGLCRLGGENGDEGNGGHCISREGVQGLVKGVPRWGEWGQKGVGAAWGGQGGVG